MRLVTGYSVAEWTSPAQDGVEIIKGAPCTIPPVVANELGRQNEAPLGISQWAPWGVHLAGHWTRGHVLASYEKLRRKFVNVLGDKEPLVVITYGPSGRTKRYLVRVAENTPQAAEQLCTRLQAEGGSCFVVRNRTEHEQMNLERLARRLPSPLEAVHGAQARMVSKRP